MSAARCASGPARPTTMRFRNKGEAMTPGWKILRVAGFGAALFTALPAWAQDAAPTVDKGDTAWMMTATILVLMMILPGLALFKSEEHTSELQSLMRI